MTDGQKRWSLVALSFNRPFAQISFLSSAFRMSLIHFLLVNRDAGIRADNRTRCASDAGIGHIMAIDISSVVHFVGCKCQRMCRASHDTQVASFATFFVNDDGSFYFAHSK